MHMTRTINCFCLVITYWKFPQSLLMHIKIDIPLENICKLSIFPIPFNSCRLGKSAGQYPKSPSICVPWRIPVKRCVGPSVNSQSWKGFGFSLNKPIIMQGRSCTVCATSPVVYVIYVVHAIVLMVNSSRPTQQDINVTFLSSIRLKSSPHWFIKKIFQNSLDI